MSAKNCTTHFECDCIATHRVEMGAEIQRLREALRLIAMGNRADGTYNRSREACGEIARQALGETTRNAEKEKAAMPQCQTWTPGTPEGHQWVETQTDRWECSKCESVVNVTRSTTQDDNKGEK